MIRLRETLERGMRHRWLGPLLIVAFCILLALVLLHAAHEGQGAPAEFGAFCVAIAFFVGLLFVSPAGRLAAAVTLSPSESRAPPRLSGRIDILGPFGRSSSASLRL